MLPPQLIKICIVIMMEYETGMQIERRGEERGERREEMNEEVRGLIVDPQFCSVLAKASLYLCQL